VRDHEPAGRGDTADDRHASIDDLLDRAVFALNSGDREAATALAGEVLAIDDTNTDAEDLLAAPDETGEMRRLTLVFIDLVESTQLSTRLAPEPYRMLVGKYRELVTRTVERHQRNAKLQLTVLLAPPEPVPGLYLHPDHRRRRSRPPLRTEFDV
jgi:hypothetical protein